MNCNTTHYRANSSSVPGDPTVNVAEAKVGSIRSTLTYSGTIQPSQQVSVAPRTAGQLTSVRVDTGATVRAGDVLATLDPGTLGAQALQAQANVDAAQARLQTVLTGPKAVDVTAAQSQLAAAQARLDQLMNPSATDRAAVDTAVATAQNAIAQAKAAADGARSALLGAISAYCNYTFSFGIPCGNITMPLPADQVANVTSTVQTAVGLPTSDVGQRALAMLAANTAYATAIAAVDSAQQAATAATARRDALLHPSASDVAGARSAVDQARSALDARQNPYTDSDVQAARAAVAQAQAGLVVAQTALEQTVIKAPFDGVIAQRILGAGAAASPAQPVFVLNAQAVEVHFTVEEARVGAIRPDMEAALSVAALPGATFAAKVASISPTGDSRAHTFDVKVLASDGSGRLLPGMLAQVNVVTASKSATLVVPASAVIIQAGAPAVYVVTDGRATARAVQTGITDTTSIEVVTGLTAGDRVVVVGQNGLRDGQAVAVATTAPST